MINTLLSCWEYSQNHKHVLPVTVFLQFDCLVDSKVGFNQPFHSIRGPLDSGLCGVEQPTLSTHEERGPIILVVFYASQSKTEGVVTGWKEVNPDECEFSGRHPSIARTKHNEEPKTVRTETGLYWNFKASGWASYSGVSVSVCLCIQYE